MYLNNLEDTAPSAVIEDERKITIPNAENPAAAPAMADVRSALCGTGKAYWPTNENSPVQPVCMYSTDVAYIDYTAAAGDYRGVWVTKSGTGTYGGGLRNGESPLPLPPPDPDGISIDAGSNKNLYYDTGALFNAI